MHCPLTLFCEAVLFIYFPILSSMKRFSTTSLPEKNMQISKIKHNNYTNDRLAQNQAVFHHHDAQAYI